MKDDTILKFKESLTGLFIFVGLHHCGSVVAHGYKFLAWNTEYLWHCTQLVCDEADDALHVRGQHHRQAFPELWNNSLTTSHMWVVTFIPGVILWLVPLCGKTSCSWWRFVGWRFARVHDTAYKSNPWISTSLKCFCYDTFCRDTVRGSKQSTCIVQHMTVLTLHLCLMKNSLDLY